MVEATLLLFSFKATMAGSSGGGNSPPDLLAVVLDVSPSTWGHRDLVRAAKDKANAAKGKPSSGPATLDDVVTAVLSFGSAFACLGRDAAVIVAASEGEVAVLYPRKGGGGVMGAAVDGASSSGGEGECSQRIDAGTMAEQVRLGVAELVDRSARIQAEDAAADVATVGNQWAGGRLPCAGRVLWSVAGEAPGPERDSGEISPHFCYHTPKPLVGRRSLCSNVQDEDLSQLSERLIGRTFVHLTSSPWSRCIVTLGWK